MLAPDRQPPQRIRSDTWVVLYSSTLSSYTKRSGHTVSLTLVMRVPLFMPTTKGVSFPLATALAIAVGSVRGV